jgi:hypothetical protein
MSETKDSLIQKLKDIIPGSIDDQIIDKAIQAVEGSGDASSGAIHTTKEKVNDAADQIKQAIPGNIDDSIIDKLTSVFADSDRNDYTK